MSLLPDVKCYVYNPNEKYTLPEFVQKDDYIFYPEKSMTFSELMNVPLPNKNIVTDSPFLVPLYDSINVYIYREDFWVSVYEELGFQTFGTSYEIIMSRIFNHKNSIPLIIEKLFLT